MRPVLEPTVPDTGGLRGAEEREVGHPLIGVSRSASKTTVLVGCHISVFYAGSCTQWLELRFGVENPLRVYKGVKNV